MLKQLQARFDEAARRNIYLIAVFAIIINPLWIIFYERFLAGEHFSFFLTLRIILAGLGIFSLIALRKRWLHWKIIGYVLVLYMIIMLSYMINVINTGAVHKYFMPLFMVTMIAALFVYFKWWEYALIGVINVVALAVFMFFIKKHTFQTLFENGLPIVLTGGIFGTVFSYIKYKRLWNEQRLILELQEATEEYKELTAELEAQREELFEKNATIVEGLSYARYLQEALLNHTDVLEKYFPRHFMIYLPKDIIAGDFVWVDESDEWIFVALADSTGHGIRGAMVSMINYIALEYAFFYAPKLTPAGLLNEARSFIVELFTKRKENKIMDGMDVSMVAIKKDRSKVLFAGANMGMVAFYPDTEEKFMRFKGDRIPVGVSLREGEYTDHEVPVEGLKNIYLYSDGVVDQTGGTEGKKLKVQGFLRALAFATTQPIEFQKELLLKFIMKWKGEGNEQVDDITILGIEIGNV